MRRLTKKIESQVPKEKIKRAVVRSVKKYEAHLNCILGDEEYVDPDVYLCGFCLEYKHSNLMVCEACPIVELEGTTCMNEKRKLWDNICSAESECESSSIISAISIMLYLWGFIPKEERI